MTQSIYLAGPDVFRQDARSFGDDLKALCSQYGFTGLYPLDNDLPAKLARHERAEWIYKHNLELIGNADILMANLNDFRGEGEPDSGTAFEVGYAKALNKPVWGYTSERASLMNRVHTPTGYAGTLFDSNGYAVEDFGLTMNLMLAVSVHLVIGTARDCLIAIAAYNAKNG